MREVQERFTGLLHEAVDAEVETETCPPWLLRPGRAECAAAWEPVREIYAALTGLELPEQAPPRERRRLDVVLTYRDGRRQVLEVDEGQHFTAARAVTLQNYPDKVALGFDRGVWLARSWELSGRERGGGFAKPRPPLFPGDGGRHRQRAFRDALADLLPAQHGWLPTLRISDTEAIATFATSTPLRTLCGLLAKRGVLGARLNPEP